MIKSRGDSRMTEKDQIIELFHKNVKGKRANLDGMNVSHDGRGGYWLEEQFGIEPNGKNEADLLGYELKNETVSKTTFGDWSANQYIFKSSEYSHLFEGKWGYEKQDSFVKIFGKSNTEKDGRYSWSGEPCPKIGDYNSFGQRLEVTKNKDIIAVYSYSHDKRENKSTIVPRELQQEHLELARWFGVACPGRGKCLKDKLEDKFNDKGWFTCKTDNDGTYRKLCFGNPMNYDEWLKLVQSGIVFLDSGMHENNKRPYSQWRANNNFWDSLITEEYE